MRVARRFQGTALAILAAVIGTGSGGAVWAQTAEGGAPPAAEVAAEAAPVTLSAAEAAALRERGEGLLYGIAPAIKNVAAGVELLDQAAQAGDVAAQELLGKVLIDGYYLPAEPERGLALLEMAAAAGSGKARLAMAQTYLWGLGVPTDTPRAQALLQEASDAGYTPAQALLGEQLIGGWVLPRDVAAGQALLEKASGEGEVKAKLALGSFQLYGIGLPKNTVAALALFEEAAEAGNGEGLAQYGEMLMWKNTDPEAAEAYLTRAGDLGVGAAWTILAEGAMYGYLGPRRKFDAFAEKARAVGSERIEVLDATRRMWGISMRANGPETLWQLTQAAEAGNAEAAKFLISLLRDGNRMNIRRDLPEAELALEHYTPLLSERELWQYRLTFAAKRARYDRRYEEVAQLAAEHPEHMTTWLGKELYQANPNVAIYMVQKLLQRDGLYGGKLDGYVGPLTVGALKKACETIDQPAACRDSVLRPEVIAAVLVRG